MNPIHANPLPFTQAPQDRAQDSDFLQDFDASGDPVEAYFECITQCSLDDGECVTVCTTILRDQT